MKSLSRRSFVAAVCASVAGCCFEKTRCVKQYDYPIAPPVQLPVLPAPVQSELKPLTKSPCGLGNKQVCYTYIDEVYENKIHDCNCLAVSYEKGYENYVIVQGNNKIPNSDEIMIYSDWQTRLVEKKPILVYRGQEYKFLNSLEFDKVSNNGMEEYLQAVIKETNAFYIS